MTLTKTLISTKVAAVVVGFAMMMSLIAAVPANAQSTDLQAQITALLAQVAALQSQLGQTTGGGSMMSACTFTRDLTMGAKGADVTCLQDTLKAKGFFKNPTSTGYFGSVTMAAVKAWQASAGITPAAGYFGKKSQAAFAAMGGGTVGSGSGTVVPTGTALSVMKSVDSPANTALIAGQAVADIAHFTFSNPTGTEAKITSLVFDRTGVSNDATFANIFLYNGGTRITDAASVSSAKITFNDAGGILTVPANSTVTISVRADIATGRA